MSCCFILLTFGLVCCYVWFDVVCRVCSLVSLFVMCWLLLLFVDVCWRGYLLIVVDVVVCCCGCSFVVRRLFVVIVCCFVVDC